MMMAFLQLLRSRQPPLPLRAFSVDYARPTCMSLGRLAGNRRCRELQRPAWISERLNRASDGFFRSSTTPFAGCICSEPDPMCQLAQSLVDTDLAVAKSDEF